MKTNTASMYGAFVQSNILFDKPYEFVPNTTLNERHEVQAGVVPNTTERMAIRYWGIGRGGHRNMTGEGEEFYTTEELHDARDASMFKPIPFIIRPIENDLDPATRAKYAMRVVQPINGRTYVLYYLRRMDTSRVSPQMMLNLVNGNNVTSKPFVPTRENLFPVAQRIPTNTETEVSGEYGSVSTIIETLLTADEVSELIEACRILYNNPNYAVISEIAIVAGADRIVKGQGVGAGTIDYSEALCATVMSILITYHLATATNRGIKETLEMGTTEPTLINTRVTTSG